jgi:hypothetical protein
MELKMIITDQSHTEERNFKMQSPIALFYLELLLYEFYQSEKIELTKSRASIKYFATKSLFLTS